WDLDEGWVRAAFKRADEACSEAQAALWIEGEDALSKNSEAQPERVESKGEVEKPKIEPVFKRRITNLAVPKPKPEEEKKAAVEFKRRYGWAEVVIPEGVDEIEALTYVPGLVGQIVEWIVAGARRPNRVMALGVALAVVGTLIGRRVEGPTGCATHLYIFILAPTGWGKDHPLWC